MYASTTFILTAILALTQIAVATPPACLLAVVGVYTNPSDLKALCGTLQESVVANITSKCVGSAQAPAYKAYSATCLSEESVTVTATVKSSTTSTGTSTASRTASVSGSSATATGTRASAAGTGTQTGASPTSTGNSAGSNSPQMALAVLAAGFVYFL